MATAPLLTPVGGEVITTAGTDIVVAVAQNPGIVLLDSQKFDAFYEKLKAKAPADVDVSTRKGRETLRSFAAEVRSEKAAIDKARLRLTKEWRDMTSQANAAGKVIEERLEGLAVEVRAPLTAWEEAEKARVAECQAAIETLRAAAIVTPEDTSAAVRERGKAIWETAIDADRFGDLFDDAETAKAQTVATLKAALARLTQEEADRAELERLRAEAAAREEADRLAAEAAAEKARAEQAERDRLAEAERQRIAAAEAAAAEAARLEQARADAAAAAQREAERLAQEERDRVQREHEAALAAERQRAEEAERAAQADRDRIAAEEAARAAEAKRLADEQAAREANQKHRTTVKPAAKEAIMTCGVSEECAQKIVLAIIAGEVPAVTLKF